MQRDCLWNLDGLDRIGRCAPRHWEGSQYAETVPQNILETHPLFLSTLSHVKYVQNTRPILTAVSTNEDDPSEPLLEIDPGESRVENETAVSDESIENAAEGWRERATSGEGGSPIFDARNIRQRALKHTIENQYPFHRALPRRRAHAHVFESSQRRQLALHPRNLIKQILDRGRFVAHRRGRVREVAQREVPRGQRLVPGLALRLDFPRQQGRELGALDMQRRCLRATTTGNDQRRERRER